MKQCENCKFAKLHNPNQRKEIETKLKACKEKKSRSFLYKLFLEPENTYYKDIKIEMFEEQLIEFDNTVSCKRFPDSKLKYKTDFCGEWKNNE